jgi:YD repeat-containing protein
MRIAGLALLGILTAFAAEAGTTYTYDDLGRLSTVTYDNGRKITYTYDPAGNRTQVVTEDTGQAALPSSFRTAAQPARRPSAGSRTPQQSASR